MRRMVFLLLVMAAAFPVIASGPARASEPWQYIKVFQAFQDRIAHGDRKAYRAHVRLIAYLGREFAALPDETWKKRLNAEALFIYLLSGGDPAAATGLLKRKVEVALPEGALQGAVAFVRGHNGKAWKFLQKVDEKGMSTAARAQLALVKASLRAATQQREALHLLARVRLMKPGTLMEEVALRRALFLAGGEGDEKAFMRLASAYIRRFRDSWYASDFLRRFSWLLVRLDYGRRPFLVERMEPLVSMLSKRQQALLHAAVSRAAIVEGKSKLAVFAGRKALNVYPDASRFVARVKTWIAAGEVVDDPEAALEMLKGISPELLDRRDRELRLAAIGIGQAILAEPSPANLPRGKAEASQESDNLPVLVRAQALIAGIDKFVEEGTQ